MGYSRLFLRLLALALASVLIVGCSRDPNVRKQKYFESGQRYFAKGQFKEAAIQYSNALQVDPQFVRAHYELAQCYLRTGEYARAYSEL